MNIINLTPHTITIAEKTLNAIQVKHVLNPSGLVARCVQEKTLIDKINDIDIYKTSFGKVTDLPRQQAHTIYITSSLVASAVKGMRDDVFIPTDFLRDKQGNIIGCQALAQL